MICGDRGAGQKKEGDELATNDTAIFRQGEKGAQPTMTLNYPKAPHSGKQH
jgi:hypothetical protein